MDAGIPLPNVSLDFTGPAPDLGAGDFAKPVPVCAHRLGSKAIRLYQRGRGDLFLDRSTRRWDDFLKQLAGRSEGRIFGHNRRME